MTKRGSLAVGLARRGHRTRCTVLSRSLALAIVAWGLVGCAKSVDSTSVALAAGNNANNTKDYCKLYSPQQIKAALGKPAKPGYADPVKAMEGCEWPAADGKGRLFVEVLNRGLWFDLSGGTGQHPVFGIGEKAYVGPSSLGGDEAGAVTEDNFYLVIIDPAPKESVITDLLRDFVARAPH